MSTTDTLAEELAEAPTPNYLPLADQACADDLRGLGDRIAMKGGVV